MCIGLTINPFSKQDSFSYPHMILLLDPYCAIEQNRCSYVMQRRQVTGKHSVRKGYTIIDFKVRSKIFFFFNFHYQVAYSMYSNIPQSKILRTLVKLKPFRSRTYVHFKKLKILAAN